jgi:hypothetical protein
MAGGAVRQAMRRGMGARRAGALLGAALAVLVSIGGRQALASAGCDAVNAGGFNDSNAEGGSSKTVQNFAVGDKVTFNITTHGGSWSLSSGNGTVLETQDLV